MSDAELEENSPLVHQAQSKGGMDGTISPRSARIRSRILFFSLICVGITVMLILIAIIFVVVWFSIDNTNPDVIPPFGHEMKIKMFTLDNDAYILNHGSYGAAALPVQESFLEYFHEMNLNTNQWFSTKCRPIITQTRQDFAKYINADEDEVVLVENASSGVNSVIRSFNMSSKDGILYFTFEYPMTRNVIRFVSERLGVSLYEVEIHFHTPVSNEIIIQAVNNAFTEHGSKITFCVFDHISSTPAMILPIKQLAEICHNNNAPVLIDGAHAIGQIPLDMKDYDVDFYLTNIHKWLLGIPGSAILYVEKRWHDLIFPAVISTTYDPFLNRFQWQGTKDTSAWMSMRAALDFRNELTDDAVHEYNDNLCADVMKLFTDDWETVPPVPSDMLASLVNVRVPCNVEEPKCYDWNVGQVNGALQNDEKIWTVIFDREGIRYFRISCQIYNEYSEYVHLKETFERIVGMK